MKITEVNVQCDLVKQQLFWNNLTESSKKNIYGMILYKHLFMEKFATENDWPDIINRSMQIYEIIKKKKFPDSLTQPEYEMIYSKLFVSLRPNFRNRTGLNLSLFNDRTKEVKIFTPANQINYMWSKLSKKTKKIEYSLERIHQWICVEFLDKIHPFQNKNFLFSSVLLDYYLIQHGYLPIAWKVAVIKRDYHHLQGNNGFDAFLVLLDTMYKNYHY